MNPPNPNAARIEPHPMVPTVRIDQGQYAALLKDKERLDWLYQKGNGKRISYLSRLDSWLVDANPHQPFENPRAAIDAARKG